jgi:hypothetical protein
MIIVGVMAVDLAIVRALWGSKYHVLTGIAFTGVVLNAGVFCLVRGRGRGRSRAFWAGFLLGGLLAVGSYTWAMTYPKAGATFIDQRTGAQVTIRSSGAPLSDQWESYLDLVEDSLGGLPDWWNPFAQGELTIMVADAAIAFVPQFVVALAAGLFCWLVAQSAAGVNGRTRGMTAGGGCPRTGDRNGDQPPSRNGDQPPSGVGAE